MLDVIYDGQCGFCVRSLKWCRALDVRGAFRFHDANAREHIHAMFPELAGADFENAMFAVAPDRRVTRGFFASAAPPGEPADVAAAALFYLPAAARSDHGCTRGSQEPGECGCASDVCELPPAGRVRSTEQCSRPRSSKLSGPPRRPFARALGC